MRFDRAPAGKNSVFKKINRAETKNFEFDSARFLLGRCGNFAFSILASGVIRRKNRHRQIDIAHKLHIYRRFLLQNVNCVRKYFLSSNGRAIKSLARIDAGAIFEAVN
jgi:hypothetical protein